MRLRAGIVLLLVLGAGGLAALAAADAVTGLVERSTRESLARAMTAAGHGWAEIATDGLLVALTGTAPTPKARDHALALAGRIVSAERISSQVALAPEPPAAKTPDVSITLLRDGTRVTLTGLVPDTDTRLNLARALHGLEVVDTLVRRAVAPPERWAQTRDVALAAAAALGRGRIEAQPCTVSVAGTMPNAAARDALAAQLDALKAQDAECRTEMAIVLPRPLVSPYRFEMTVKPNRAWVSACAAPDADAVARIEHALKDVPLARPFACTEALGAPSADWTGAVTAAVTSLVRLGAGRIAIADTEVRFEPIGPDGEADRALAEEAVLTLAKTLPRGFLLHGGDDQAAADPTTAEDRAGTRPQMRFIAATSGRETGIELQGPLRTEAARKAVASYAAAYFGLTGLEVGLSVEPDLPDDWTARVMAALDALALLEEGEASVEDTRIRLVGWSSVPTANAAARGILSRVARSGLAMEVEIAFDGSAAHLAEPAPELPAPETCVTDIQVLLAAGQISFPSSSTIIQASSYPLLDSIAEILKGCTPARFEIGGHTDDSGRAEKNMDLSRGRAEAVVDALLARGVYLERMVAKGYGETEPIADNSSDEGKALNRRIGIKLLGLLEPADELE
ncbi:MAG: OmpA family protein [Pseudomonadota bacterium]